MAPTQVSAAFGIIITLVVALSALVWCIRRQQHKQKRAQGVIWLQALRSMLMHIQRHRGLSTTVLGNDRGLSAELEDAQRSVSRDLAHIALVGDWIKNNPNWDAITAHWARLAGQYQRLDVRKNLDQHNRLIRSILVFIDDVAAEHFLIGLQVGEASWRSLLTLAEELGQVRAIGLAYIACVERGDNAPKLRNALQSQLGEFMLALEEVENKRPLPETYRKKLLQFITNYPEPLLRDSAACTLKTYYQHATGVMDELYLQFDDELRHLVGQTY